MTVRSFAAIGEVMLELRPLVAGERRYGMAFAGDTFNTAIALARLGVDTGYATLLGRDRFSDDIVAFAEREGLDMGATRRVDFALPGLYLIENDEQGEREFYYWRQNSAARQTLVSRDGLDDLLARLQPFDAVYLSGITAAVMGLSAEANFWSLIEELHRQGKILLFDPNYRPRLWPDAATAAAWCERIARHCDWVFPTFDDEKQLWGLNNEEAVLAHYRDLGVEEIVLKCPNALAIARCGSEVHRLASSYDGPVMDTTGAGDAFNAGYIAARLQGREIRNALAAAHKAAARVIAVAGAIPPAGTCKED